MHCNKYTLENPEGAIKNGQPRETDNTESTRRKQSKTTAGYVLNINIRNNKNKNTNNVNKI